MTEPNWTALGQAQDVPAPRKVLWVKIHDYVHGPHKLKIEATGNWDYDEDKSCGPDGRISEGFSDANLHKSALRGCLLAKIGGSAADNPGSDKLYAIGSYGVIIPGESAGPLYVTMNDEMKNFTKHGGSLHITLAEAP